MSSKKKKKQKDKAAATPLDLLQRALQEAAAEDVDDDGLDQVSDASHSDSLSSSAHSSQGPSDQPNPVGSCVCDPVGSCVLLAMRLACKQPSFSRYAYSGEDQCLVNGTVLTQRGGGLFKEGRWRKQSTAEILALNTHIKDIRV